MDENTPDLFTLEDDEGKEVTFQLLDKMEIDGVTYYAMTPVDDEEIINGDGELVVLMDDVNATEEGMLVTVDDEEKLDRIGEIFINRINEMYDDEDEEDFE